MIIEILYPNLCNLFGDRGNVVYLKKCLSDSTFIETSIDEEPYFVKNNADLIYMGPMSENSQIIIKEKLEPYINKLNELINKGTTFLLTGNAMEVFGNQVVDKDGTIFKGLGLLDINSNRDMINRKNSIFLGKYKDIEIVAFQSQFTTCTTSEEKIFEKIYGIGLNDNDNYAGIRKNNLIATYLIGPILVLNPEFTKLVLRKDELPFQEDLKTAYDVRLEEYKRIINKQ
ncbi:MAG: hypothetical protein Q4E33_00210 [Erysipelotrichaceae bacterium]|nr:hypothetical protein [Erysipelotrichaceae bacterium]